MREWIRQHRLETVLLGLILLLAAFLRLYQIDQYMTFLGDEGRDALIIKGILVDHDLPFIGPPTSVGNIYLGPLYYYMMAVAMTVGWLNPVAAAVMVALIGVAAVFLVYYLARTFFGSTSGLIAALLYASSFVVITYSRSSWNPNPAPFFTLLAMISFVWLHRTGKMYYLLLVGAFVSAAIQMHYLCLILLPIFGALSLLELTYLPKKRWSNFVVWGLAAVVVFLLGLTPWWLFEYKHNFMNSKAMTDLFFGGHGSVEASPLASLLTIWPIFQQKLMARYLAADNFWFSIDLAAIVLFVLGKALYKRRQLSDPWPYYLLAIWLGVGLLGMTFYKQDIYDHYLGFLSPAPFLILSALFEQHRQRSGWRWGLAGSLVLAIVVMNLWKTPILSAPQRQLQRTQLVAQRVIELTDNQPFNFALLAEHNYDAAYQFYLWKLNHSPEKLPFTKTDQLMVVCEDAICQPINNPKYEIAAFGWIKIAKEEDYGGVKIFKLVHNIQ